MTTQRLTTPRPAVLDEVAAAVLAEWRARPSVEQVVELGPARFDAQHSGPVSATFVVDTGALRLGARFLSGLYLSGTAGPGGVGARRWRVHEVVAWEGNQLVVEVDVDPVLRRQLWSGAAESLRLCATISDSLLLRALYERLAAGRHQPGLAGPIVDALQRAPGGRPKALPSELGIILGPAERREDTLAAAVAQLLESGLSVLLVCQDNAAVDRIMLAAHQAAGYPPAGVFVRASPPSVRAVATDPRLTIDGAAGQSAPHVVGRLHELAVQLRGVRPETGQSLEPPLSTTTTKGSALGTPLVGGEAAGQTVSTAHLAQARQALLAADEAVAAAALAAREASRAHAVARQLLREMEEARATYQHLDELARQVEEANADTEASAAGVGRLAAAAATARDERPLVVAAEVAATRLERRNAALAELVRLTEQSQAVPFRRSEVAAAERNLERTRTAHATAERAALQARAERARVAAIVAQLSAPAGGHLAAETSADASPDGGAGAGAGAGGRGDLPALSEVRRPMEAAAQGRAERPGEAGRIARLLAEYAQARAELLSYRGLAIQRARVVGASLEQLVTYPGIYGRTYDIVLIEQAGALPAAFALWAATRADRAVTLAVEPSQRPAQPILSAEPGGGNGDFAGAGVTASAEHTGAERWMAVSLAALAGLDDPPGVAAHVSGLILE